MSTIEELLIRVEAATGPDRELDIDLCLALNYIAYDDAPMNLRRSQDDPGWLDYECEEAGKLVDCTDKPPELSHTIDAALALVERELPGWRRRVTIETHKVTADLYLLDTDFTGKFVMKRFESADAMIAPLAILAALLRALRQQLYVRYPAKIEHDRPGEP